MPYAVRKRGNKYVVINKETGKTKGTHTSKSKAESQMRLLRGVEHGWKPTGKKITKKKTKKSKR